MKHWLFAALILLIGLSACTASPTDTTIEEDQPSAPQEMGMGQGMGPGSGMRERHHADIPEEYKGLSNPLSVDDETLEIGADIYEQHCASCHGDDGMGGGPAGEALDPRPSPVSHSLQMMGDSYAFWRISEGGTSFETAMPPWKNSLTEDERWAVILYIRVLEQEGSQPDREAIQAENHAAMMAEAVETGVITQEEADTFDRVHDIIESYVKEHAGELTGESPAEREEQSVDALIADGTLTQDDIDAFHAIHDRLSDSGLMP